jgi:hypothetical protein
MPFPWSKKVNRVIPTVSSPPEHEVEPEVVQSIELPVVDDKISSIEHKNGECLASTREEDDEADEVQGDLQEGGWSQEGDHGGEEVVEQCKDEESSSPRTSLKK